MSCGYTDHPVRIRQFDAQDLERADAALSAGTAVVRGRFPVQINPPWWTRWAGHSDEVEASEWEIATGGRTIRTIVAGDGEVVVVVLPHLNGTRLLPEVATAFLARANLRVLALVPPRWAPGIASAHELLQVLAWRIRLGRTIVRLANEELPSRCTILVGVSIGAVSAIVVAALEPSVDGVVSVLGGGELEDLVAHSSADQFESFRATWAELPSADRDAVSAQLGALDPITWASKLDPARVLLVRARFDRVIPERNSAALRQAFGSAREWVAPTGH